MMDIKAVISISGLHRSEDALLAERLGATHLDWTTQSSLKEKHFKLKLREQFPESESTAQYVLVRREGLLSVVEIAAGEILTVSADFCSPTLNYRRLKGGGKGQMLAKAIGLGKESNLKVVDCTAGLGRDAFILAGLGCDVRMLERVPAVRELLRNALIMAQSEVVKMDKGFGEAIDRLTLIDGDSIEEIAGVCQQYSPDVLYLDPMFPERSKSASVKKEMRVFHGLVGEDADSAELFDSALGTEVRRIVVKRPKAAPPIDARHSPSYVLAGKSNRYDVYVK